MNLLRIGKTVINLDNVIAVHFEICPPNHIPEWNKESPVGVRIEFNVSRGSFDGVGSTDPAHLWFSGDEAAQLRAWFERRSVSVEHINSGFKDW